MQVTVPLRATLSGKQTIWYQAVRIQTLLPPSFLERLSLPPHTKSMRKLGLNSVPYNTGGQLLESRFTRLANHRSPYPHGQRPPPGGGKDPEMRCPSRGLGFGALFNRGERRAASHIISLS